MSGTRPNLPSTVLGDFEDIDHFAEITRGWDLDFRQLDRGALTASVFHVCTRDTVLQRVRFSRALDQSGGSPVGFVTFGLLEDGVSGVRWCGREAGGQTLLAFDASSGFDAVSRPGFGAYTCSITQERLARVAEMAGLPSPDRWLGGPRTFSAGQASRVTELRGWLRGLCDTISKGGADGAWLRDQLDLELPRRLLSVISSTSTRARDEPARSRRVALKKARDFIRDNLGLPPTVRQVCEHTGVSWRTLDYAFREHFDLTPQAYLKAVRLDEARRALRSGGFPSVAEAANDCGFWHMGKFASDYRSQFGELPSRTLRRPASSKSTR